MRRGQRAEGSGGSQCDSGALRRNHLAELWLDSCPHFRVIDASRVYEVTTAMCSMLSSNRHSHDAFHGDCRGNATLQICRVVAPPASAMGRESLSFASAQPSCPRRGGLYSQNVRETNMISEVWRYDADSHRLLSSVTTPDRTSARSESALACCVFVSPSEGVAQPRQCWWSIADPASGERPTRSLSADTDTDTGADLSKSHPTIPALADKQALCVEGGGWTAR